MLNKLLQRFNISLRSIQFKIFLSLGFITFFSIIIVTVSIYINASNSIERNAVNYVYDSIKNANESLQMMLEDMDNMSIVIAINENTVMNSINSKNSITSYDFFVEKKRTEEFLFSLRAYKSYVSRIAVAGFSGRIFQTDNRILSDSILHEPWVGSVTQTNQKVLLFNAVGERSLSLARCIYYDSNPLGFVLIDFNPDMIKRIYNIKPLSDSYIFVLNDKGEFVFNSDQSMSERNIMNTSFKDLFSNLDSIGQNELYRIGDKRYLTIKYISQSTGLISIGVVPYDSLMRDAIIIRNQMVSIIIIVIFVALFVSIAMSRQITKNVKKLTNTMKQVLKGDLHARPDILSKDEIGQLSDGFVQMMDNINNLMHDIKSREQQKREAELKVLQAQISPHFLYNTLNTIRYLSIIQNVKNIEEVSVSLIELLRSVVGNGREFVTIGEELRCVKNYIEIQKYKFLDRLEFRINADENVLELKTLKLILQPIVENSLLHGIADTNKGLVTIDVFEEDGKVVFVTTDNGIGMSEELIQKIMTGQVNNSSSNFSGIGIKNVDERIKMIFGSEYGVEIFSKPGEYSKVRILIPVIKEGTSYAENTYCR